MNILENKVATLYKYSRNSTTKVSSYSTTWTSITCSIQPASTSDWLEGEEVFNTYRLYSSYLDIGVWDKIVLGGVTYIVKQVQKRRGLLRDYTKAFINESIWNN